MDKQFQDFKEKLDELHGAELRRVTLFLGDGHAKTQIYSVGTAKGKLVAEQVIEGGDQSHTLVEETYEALFGSIPDSLAGLYGRDEPV